MISIDMNIQMLKTSVTWRNDDDNGEYDKNSDYEYDFDFEHESERDLFSNQLHDFQKC